MRAWRVKAFGGTEGLEWIEQDPPSPGSEQVLVNVEAAGVNMSDVLRLAGRYVGGPTPPFIAGVEGVGTIAGEGTRVAFLTDAGAHAEQACVERAACIELPPGLSPERAALLPISLTTAYVCLVDVADVRAGETLLVTAAAGALGSAAVQIGVSLGLRVIAVASTEAKRRRAQQLGAHECVDYSEIPRCRADVALDGVGGRTTRAITRILPPRGRIVLVGFSGGSTTFDPVGLVFRSLSVHGVHLATLARDRALIERATSTLLRWIDAGTLDPSPGATLPLAEAPRAYDELRERRSLGKLVLVA